jgi:hypothetical protein
MIFSGLPFPYDASINKGTICPVLLVGVNFNSSAVQLQFVRNSSADTNDWGIAEMFHNADVQYVQASEFAAGDGINAIITYFTLT